MYLHTRPLTFFGTNHTLEVGIGKKRGRIGIRFAKDQCFQFGEKELWRDGKRRGLSSFVVVGLYAVLE